MISGHSRSYDEISSKSIRFLVKFCNFSHQNFNENNKSKVIVETQDGQKSINADIILSAVGITPNIHNIGLEGLKIALEGDRINVDQYVNIDRELDI